MHRIALDRAVKESPRIPSSDSDYDFFAMLRDAGRRAAQQFLDPHFDDIGLRSTVDLKADIQAEWGC